MYNQHWPLSVLNNQSLYCGVESNFSVSMNINERGCRGQKTTLDVLDSAGTTHLGF